MSYFDATYSNRSPLPSRPGLDRGLGVMVSEPHQRPNVGGGWSAMVEVQVETIAPSPATLATVTYCLKETWPAAAGEATAQIIDDLDRAIALLQSHRNRLAVEAARLRTRTERACLTCINASVYAGSAAQVHV
jgi:hypothetical protein